MTATQPDETVHPVTLRGVILTFVGALVLVLLCNLFIAPRLLTNAPNLAGWIIGYKWQLLFGLGKPTDWLILGDSSCNQGVDPAVLGEEMNGDAVNLCTIGDMLAVNDAWMLEWHIRNYGPPKAAVMVHVYDIWNRSFDPARMGSVPLGYSELRELSPPVRLRSRELGKYLETRYLPIYANNRSLQAVLRLGDPLRRGLGATRNVDARGFLAANVAAPDSVRRDFEGHRKWLGGKQFSMSGDNARALRHIAALAEQYQFDVYLASAPIYEGLAEDPEFRKYYADLERELQTFAPSGGRLHLLPALITFPADSMQNADHVVAGAARSYTRRLAEGIRSLVLSARTSTGEPRNRVAPVSRPGASSSALIRGNRTTR